MSKHNYRRRSYSSDRDRRDRRHRDSRRDYKDDKYRREESDRRDYRDERRRSPDRRNKREDSERVIRRSPERKDIRPSSPTEKQPEKKDNGFSSNFKAKSSGVKQLTNFHSVGMNYMSSFDKKLYVGNIPKGLNENTLFKLVSAAMKRIAPDTEDPVVDVTLYDDGKYALVDFKDVATMKLGMKLNDIKLAGQKLEVGRPANYASQIGINGRSGMLNTVALAILNGSLQNLEGTKIQFPTRVLCFKDMFKNIDMTDDNNRKNCEDDLREECVKFGRIMSLEIPREKEAKGYGSAFVEFHSLNEAKEVRKQLANRRYYYSIVKIIYFDEKKFRERNFDFTIE